MGITPTAEDDCLLVSSFHTHHSICKVKITLGGAEPLWRQPFASHVGSPVIQGDYVYLAGERLMCLAWQTGRLVWEGGAYGYGGACIAAGDGTLIVWSDRGAATLVASAGQSPAAYRPLARRAHLFPESQAWPHPALAGGRLYCKDRQGNLKCYQLGK